MYTFRVCVTIVGHSQSSSLPILAIYHVEQAKKYITKSGLKKNLFAVSELRNNVMIVCCQEARHSGNMKLAQSLMSELSKIGVDDELNFGSIRVAREAAKQVYADNNSSALQKMSTIALHRLDEGVDKNIAELVAR